MRHLMIAFMVLLSLDAWSQEQPMPGRTRHRPSSSQPQLAGAAGKDSVKTDSAKVHTPTGPDNNIDPKKTDQGNGGDGEKDIESILTPILSYNFSGKNPGISGLTPVVNYGWQKTFDKPFLAGAFTLAINPYAAGQIGIKDSGTFLPALMLPGIAGININTFIRYGDDEKVQFVWYPLNFALKLNTNFVDSNKVVLQHNLRTGAGLAYQEIFMFGMQYTYGWHNATSESQENFKQLFNKHSTDIHYLTISLQVLLNNKKVAQGDSDQLVAKSYLFGEWRGLLNKQDFPGLPNRKIITIGLRKNFDLTALMPGARH